MNAVVFSVIFLMLSPFCLRGQQVTFSPQGAAALKALTGKRIPSFQIVSVLACAETNAASLTGGSVYELAAQAGYQWIDPDAAAVIINRTVAFNGWTLAENALIDGSSFGALLVAGGVIKAGASILTSLIAGHSFLDQVQGRLKGYAPDPTPVLRKLLQADTVLSLQPHQCIDRYLGAQFHKNAQPQTFHLDAEFKPESGYNLELAYKIRDAHVAALEAAGE